MEKQINKNQILYSVLFLYNVRQLTHFIILKSTKPVVSQNSLKNIKCVNCLTLYKKSTEYSI